VESNIPDFEADPRLLRFIREGSNDSVRTGNGLFYKVVNHNQRVFPVCHKRAEVNIIFSLVGQFFFIETEDVIDNIYSNESEGQDAVSVELRAMLTNEVRNRRRCLDVRGNVRVLSGWKDQECVGLCHTRFRSKEIWIAACVRVYLHAFRQALEIAPVDEFKGRRYNRIGRERRIVLVHVPQMDSESVHDRIDLLLRCEVPLLEDRERGRILSGGLVIHVDHEPGEKLWEVSGQGHSAQYGRNRPK